MGGDWRQENGGSSLAEVERDGAVQLPAPAAARLRHLQELRGPLPRRVHGRQWRRDVGKGRVLRAQGGGRSGRQEEVRVWHAGLTLTPVFPGAACSALPRSTRTRPLGFIPLLAAKAAGRDLCKFPLGKGLASLGVGPRSAPRGAPATYRRREVEEKK